MTKKADLTRNWAEKQKQALQQKQAEEAKEQRRVQRQQQQALEREQRQGGGTTKERKLAEKLEKHTRVLQLCNRRRRPLNSSLRAKIRLIQRFVSFNKYWPLII